MKLYAKVWRKLKPKGYVVLTETDALKKDKELERKFAEVEALKQILNSMNQCYKSLLKM